MDDALGFDDEAAEMEEAPADTPGRLLPSQVCLVYLEHH